MRMIVYPYFSVDLKCNWLILVEERRPIFSNENKFFIE